jgi:hypothetical protein
MAGQQPDETANSHYITTRTPWLLALYCCQPACPQLQQQQQKTALMRRKQTLMEHEPVTPLC